MSANETHRTKVLNYLSHIRGANLKIKMGIVIILILGILCAIEPSINSFRLGGKDPMDVGTFKRWLRPSWEHPLGTDSYGRDLFALVMTGLKYTLAIGVLSGIIATLIAIVIGLISGYKGGKLDTILRSITDGFLVIPSWPILATLAAYVPKVDIITMSAILGVFSWPFAARTIRAQVLSLKEMMFVNLAKVSGLSEIEIIFKEIMVNVIPYVLVGFANSIMGAIFAETGIRIIGLGPTRIPTLGLIINWTITSGYLLQQRYLEIVVPVFLLILIFASLNIINIGLDETFNPRLKKVTGL